MTKEKHEGNDGGSLEETPKRQVTIDLSDQTIKGSQVNIGEMSGDIGQVGDNAHVMDGGDYIKGDKVIEGDEVRGNKIVHFHYAATPEESKGLLDFERSEYEREMVLIPSGTFLMGSDQGNPEEAPLHPVALEEYAIGRFPVTHEEFFAYIWDKTIVANKALRWQGNEPAKDQLCQPVTGVTWYEALDYCQWLADKTGRSYQLANEAQWEKAVRGADGRIYPWGNEWQEGRCNTAESFTAVNAFDPQSPYGCHDMVGNAREWTSSAWGDMLTSPDQAYAYPWKADRRNYPGQSSVTLRVYRGGRFSKSIDYRCSARKGLLPDMRGPKSQRHGFRLVLST